MNGQDETRSGQGHSGNRDTLDVYVRGAVREVERHERREVRAGGHRGHDALGVIGMGRKGVSQSISISLIGHSAARRTHVAVRQRQLRRRHGRLQVGHGDLSLLRVV